MTDHDLTNDSHRDGCAACAATWAELEAIAAEARQLPLLTPSRDLWAGIEARIGGGATPAAETPAAASPAMAQARRRWFALPAVRLAAAAALLVTATATVTWRIATEDRADGTPAVAAAPAATAPEGAPAADRPADATLRAVTYDAEFRTMDDEIRSLERIVDERRAQLDPRTVEVLRRNLDLIDRAIAESRAALAADPASQFLAAQLARSYTTKLTLLRSTATLPVGT